MNKGQIFSIDFVIAMILMLIFLGGLMSLGEIQNYEKKETQIQNELNEKTQAALIVLTNSPNYGCELSTNESLAYSFDLTKINSIDHTQLKENLGLGDYKLSLFISDTLVENHVENNSGPNTYAAEVTVLFCNNGITFSDLNNCYNGTCPTDIHEEKLKIEVSK